MSFLKKIISLGCAILISFLFVNILMFFYARPVAWIDTPNGPSRAVRNPNSILVHGTEGFGVTKIDSNGYTNPDYQLADNYVLMMGSSHTVGKEVASDKKYSVLVNNELAQESNELKTYNISCDGHFLPSLIKHFNAAVNYYPNAYCITIEIGDTDYSAEELSSAIEQTDTLDTRTAGEIFDQQSEKSRIKNYIKEYLPLLSRIKNNLETARAQRTTVKKYEFDVISYSEVVTEALSLIRKQYDGPIVFIYHPDILINEDGSLSIERSESFTVFESICKNVGIDCIDLGDSFVEHYKETCRLPYGFSNTTPGTGHMNEDGHRLVADAILQYLKEVD